MPRGRYKDNDTSSSESESDNECLLEIAKKRALANKTNVQNNKSCLNKPGISKETCINKINLSREQKAGESSRSESDSDEECLLEIARKRSLSIKYKVDRNNKLLQKSVENCEFCDKTFNNKFEALVHNANHIIIPLMRGSCPDARNTTHHNNTSQITETLPQHSNNTISNRIILGGKHNRSSGIKSRICFESDDDDVILLSDTDDLLNGLRTETNYKVNLADVVLNDLTTDCKVNLEALTFNEQPSHESILNNFVSDCRVILDDPLALFGIKEDDIDAFDENILLNSLTSDCKVDLGEPMVFGNVDKGTLVKPIDIVQLVKPFDIEPLVKPIELEPLIQGIPINGIRPLEVSEINSEFENNLAKPTVIPDLPEVLNDLIENSSIFNCIPNDELVKPGLYKCDVCFTFFPSRFDVIRHKSNHLYIRRAREGYCIVCEKHRRRRCSTMCNRCCQKHGHHYTEFQDLITDKNHDHTNVITQKSISRTMRVCEVCYIFLKRLRFTRLHSLKYTKVVHKRVGVLPDDDKKRKCEKCGYSSTKLVIVKKIKVNCVTNETSRPSLVNRFEFEEDGKSQKKKSSSNSLENAKRLERIRRRLKNMYF